MALFPGLLQRSETNETIEEMVRELPEPMRTAMRTIVRSRQMGQGVAMMLDRANELGSARRAMLAGALVDPASREYLDAHLRTHWDRRGEEFSRRDGGSAPAPEIIVGGGLHAAIYAAGRAAKAAREGVIYEPPIVLESSARPGGCFALTEMPAWHLNSRNQPGTQGVPGEGGALNLLPGSPVQPFDLGCAEYQDNTVMGDLVRMTLAMHANVVPAAMVRSVRPSNPAGESTIDVLMQYGPALAAARVVMATGLTMPRNPFKVKLDVDPTVMSFWGFMRRMDQPFPMRGMRRVAVIGAGDSGRAAIEALTGLGPQPRLSVAALDRPELIDWYGAGASMTEDTWCQSNRGRYRRIARLFRPDAGVARVRPLGKASYLYRLGDNVLVDGRPYSHVIVAAGMQTPQLASYTSDRESVLSPDGIPIAQRCNNGYLKAGGSSGIFEIGPAASLPLTQAETVRVGNRLPSKVQAVAIWRYAPRTRMLADQLPL